MIDPTNYQASILYSGESRTAGSLPVYGARRAAAAQEATGFSDALHTANSAGAESAATEEHSFMSFLFGLIDVINPLQHIPVISTIYRSLTGDEISPMARIAGDTLYGGPIGAAVAFADIAVEKSTGQDIGQNMLALLNGQEERQTNTMLAASYDSITPAAGTPTANDIIWTTQESADTALGTRLALLNAQEFSSSPAPTHPHHTGDERMEPVGHSTSTTQPVPSMKNGFSDVALLTAATKTAGTEPPAGYRKDSTAVLSSQETPAVSARTAELPGLIASENKFQTAVPQEQIAARMMEALDKYAALKKSNIQPSF